MECTSLSSIFSLFWKNYLSVEFQNCDIDAGVKEKDKEELPFSLLKVLLVLGTCLQNLLYWPAWFQLFLKPLTSVISETTWVKACV